MKLNKEKLLEYRDKNNLTNTELAVKIGVSCSMLYSVLNEAKKPGRKFIDGIVYGLGLPYEEIFLPGNLTTANKKEGEK